jgi:hypothetical protein
MFVRIIFPSCQRGKVIFPEGISNGNKVRGGHVRSHLGGTPSAQSVPYEISNMKPDESEEHAETAK